MTCHDYEQAIIDLARGAAGGSDAEAGTLAHLGQCAARAARLQQEQAITAGLGALARSAPAMADPEAMEARLLAAFDMHHVPVSSNWRRWLPIAAALAIAIGLPLGWLTSHRGATVESRPSTSSGRPELVEGRVPNPESRPAVEGDFVPWPGAAALPAFESGQLVRTELPASVLPLLGISQADAPAGGRVAADVLYAQDGLARAVRIVKHQSMQP